MARQYDGPARYPLQSAIGNGAYGSVYRAQDRESGAVVALKQVRIRRSDNGCPASLLREVAALKRLAAIGHDNLVRLLDVCYVRETSNLYLVFEHLDVDLATCLQNPDKVKFTKPFDPAQAFRQLMLGLAHLHKHALLHRDIKPANILLSKPHGHVKLADFGLTRVYTLACCLTSVVVTLWYRAPEVVLRTDYGTPIDIWSCGCVLAEMYLQNVPLFASESDSDVAQLKAIFSTVGLPNRDEWPADAVVPFESFSSWFSSSPITVIRENNEAVKENDEEDVETGDGGHNNFDVANLVRRLSDILPRSAPDSALDLIAKLLSFDPTRRLTVFEALDHPFIASVSTYHGPTCHHCSSQQQCNSSEEGTHVESEKEKEVEEGQENQEDLKENTSKSGEEDVKKLEEVEIRLPIHHRLPTILRQGKRRASNDPQNGENKCEVKRTPVSNESDNIPTVIISTSNNQEDADNNNNNKIINDVKESSS